MCVAAFKRELIWEGGGSQDVIRGSRWGDVEHEDTKKGFPTLVLTIKFNYWR